jgi:hypothetical protein
MARNIPKFSELPLRSGDPPYAAWGLYGDKDEKGTINRLTDEIILKAAAEIQTGTRCVNLVFLCAFCDLTTLVESR